MTTIPSCSSSSSGSTTSGWMQSRYGPEKERLYNFCSSDNQKRGAFLRIFFASPLSLVKAPSFKNITMGSIQLGPTLIWCTLTLISLGSVGINKSSTRMTLGRPYFEEVAKVARESAWVFLLLGIYCIEKDSKSYYSCRALLRSPCILWSLASSSPLTCPMINWVWENLNSFTS